MVSGAMVSGAATLEHGLLTAKVAHARHHPRRHAFMYGVYYLCFDLADRAQLKNIFLSLDRFNLFSFYTRDHGLRKAGVSLENWVRDILQTWEVPQADGPVILLTLPRILGYVFNPVSFWFCLDREKNLRAVISEVGNTFGEHHSYISFHDDRRAIADNDWLRAEKVFHVSPFMDVDGYYLFRFHYRDDKIGVWINHHNANGLMLTTSLTGKRTPLTDKNLLANFFRYPLVSFKVIALIHAEAVRLLLKGMRYRPKPLPPTTPISR